MASLGNSDNAIASYREALRTALTARARMPGEESTRTVIAPISNSVSSKLFPATSKTHALFTSVAYSWHANSSSQKPDDPVRNQL